MKSEVRVKICGLWREEDIEVANKTKPDYVGFVFAKSKRQVSFERAATLREKLARDIIAVGVFVDAPVMNIAELVNAGVIDMVQLHGNENDEYIRELKLHIGETPIVSSKPCELADYLIFDGAVPGSGKIFDWTTIPKTLQPFFLAGGLNPDNVSEAIAVVKPFAVDISSGVELDGVKNADLVAAFVANARSSQAIH